MFYMEPTTPPPLTRVAFGCLRQIPFYFETLGECDVLHRSHPWYQSSIRSDRLLVRLPDPDCWMLGALRGNRYMCVFVE